MTPEEENRLADQLAADARTRRRWESAYAVFATVVGLIVGAAVLAFQLWREWHIWR